jgi:hypothetical protein
MWGHKQVSQGAKLCLAALILILLCTGNAIAQQPVSSADVAALLKRIDELEQRVKTLEAQQSPAGTVAVSQLQLAVEAKPMQDEMTTAMAHDMVDSNRHIGQLSIRGFADVGWGHTDRAGDTNSFHLGQFNLFITSRLSDNSSVIAETVFESDDRNAFGVELERLLYNYSPNEYFNLSAGRYHTSIGFYNTAYHHSSWMQTAMNRPFLFAFEDEGGILPVHNVGLSLTGAVPSGKLGLHYIAEIGNGRTSRSLLFEPVQDSIDENNRKSFNLGFIVKPEPWRGFQAGFNVYNDRLMPDGLPRIGETILAGHIVYQNPRFEFLNEALVVRHTPEGLGHTFNTPGWYSQVSKQFGNFRPYLRYQYVNANSIEPIYHDVGLTHGPSLGMRYNFNEFTAFKVQYDRNMYSQHSDQNGIGLQVAFAF